MNVPALSIDIFLNVYLPSLFATFCISLPSESFNSKLNILSSRVFPSNIFVPSRFISVGVGSVFLLRAVINIVPFSVPSIVKVSFPFSKTTLLVYPTGGATSITLYVPCANNLNITLPFESVVLTFSPPSAGV